MSVSLTTLPQVGAGWLILLDFWYTMVYIRAMADVGAQFEPPPLLNAHCKKGTNGKSGLLLHHNCCDRLLAGTQNQTFSIFT